MKKIESWLAKNAKERYSIVPSPYEVTTAILIPDGSKKGWPEARIGECIRNGFIEFLESFNYEDGSSPIDYVEVGYGEFGQKVLRGNCKNQYSDEEYAK